MRNGLIVRLLVSAALLVAGFGVVVAASATTSKALPICKAGHKSTKTHRCRPKPKPKKTVTTKTTTTAKTTTTTKTTTTQTTTVTTSGGSTATAGTTNPLAALTGPQVGCAPGQTIDQNGDGAGTPSNDDDDDNSAGTDDGDGCL